MYKINSLLLITICSFFVFSLSGCKKNNDPNNNSSTEKYVSVTKNDKVDFDFSTSNYNILSGQIFDMMINSDKYLGKSVHFSGQFFSNIEEQLGQRFYSILRYDETACCQIGFEFKLPDKYEYPQDYPEEGADIEITGILSLETINELDHYYIDAQSLKLIN